MSFAPLKGLCHEIDRAFVDMIIRCKLQSWFKKKMSEAPLAIYSRSKILAVIHGAQRFIRVCLINLLSLHFVGISSQLARRIFQCAALQLEKYNQ